MHFAKAIILIVSLVICKPTDYKPAKPLPALNIPKDRIPAILNSQAKPDTMAQKRQEMVDYAKTFLGTPYVYACMKPDVGFDCSGFINYVFDHFNIAVPRSSVDFTNMGRPVSIEDAQPGDLILFTGTNIQRRIVGHIGIVVENDDTLKFIHASSGEADAVIITPLNDYYQSRLMKIIDVLSDDSTEMNMPGKEVFTKTIYTHHVHRVVVHHRSTKTHHPIRGKHIVKKKGRSTIKRRAVKQKHTTAIHHSSKLHHKKK